MTSERTHLLLVTLCFIAKFQPEVQQMFLIADVATSVVVFFRAWQYSTKTQLKY